MAEPGLLGWDPGSRVLLGSVLLTTARHTLGLSILSSGERDVMVGRCVHTGSLTQTHSPSQSQTWAATEQCVRDVMRSIQEADGRWGGTEGCGGPARKEEEWGGDVEPGS